MILQIQSGFRKHAYRVQLKFRTPHNPRSALEGLESLDIFSLFLQTNHRPTLTQEMGGGGQPENNKIPNINTTGN